MTLWCGLFIDPPPRLCVKVLGIAVFIVRIILPLAVFSITSNCTVALTAVLIAVHALAALCLSPFDPVLGRAAALAIVRSIICTNKAFCARVKITLASQMGCARYHCYSHSLVSRCLT